VNTLLTPGNLTILLVLLVGTSTVSAADTSSSEATLAQYVKALTTLEEKFDHCQGEGNFSRFVSARGGKEGRQSRSKVSFAFSDGKGRQIQEFPPATGSSGSTNTNDPKFLEMVSAYNPRYSFKITRKPATEAFMIDTIEPGPDRGRLSILNSLAYLALCSSMTYHSKISWTIGRPGFRVDRVDEIASAPGQSRRLKLTYSIPLPPELRLNAVPITAGWFVVAPEDGWLLHEYGSVHENPKQRILFTQVGRVTYARGATGSTVPGKSQFRSYPGKFDSDPADSDPSIAPTSGEDFEFTSFRFADSPDRDFTLSAFGLPEFGQTVAQVSSARSRPWWILVVAVLSGIAAFGLRRVATKYRNVKVSPAS
jgi:hypothetical protein